MRKDQSFQIQNLLNFIRKDGKIQATKKVVKSHGIWWIQLRITKILGKYMHITTIMFHNVQDRWLQKLSLKNVWEINVSDLIANPTWCGLIMSLVECD